MLTLLAPLSSAQDLYDPSVLRTLSFQFHDANWATLIPQNWASQTNILADLTVDGVTYPNVGVRARGNTSFSALPTGSQKWSLNVEMDFVVPGQTLLGYDSLNLNNAFTDPTFCREVAYNNFISRYIPNGRANHVQVTLNGANWGVYTNIQQWNKDVLREWFDDEDGVRVKCANNPNGPGLQYNGPTQAGYTGYEIKNDGGLADPWGALIAACNAVTNGSVATWETSIDSVIAIDPSIWEVVLENLFADDDSYINKGADFVTYRNPYDGRMHIEQTDGNETFKFDTWTPTRNFTLANKPFLSHVVNAVPELRQRCMAHMRAALTEFNWTLLGAEFTSYRNRIDAAVQADPKKLHSYANFTTNFTTSVNLGAGPGGGTVQGLQAFVNNRLALMNANAEVAAPAPFIANVAHTPAAPAPGTPVFVTATVTQNGFPINKVELFYNAAPGRFLRVAMLDNGASGDGAAGDGVYGAQVPIAGTGGQRVRYYVAATANNSFLSMRFFPTSTELAPLDYSYTAISAGMRVTEFMYSGVNGEFFEITNLTASPIDLTGWSMDDDSATPGVFSLSGAGIVAPGQAILVTDVAPATFATAWGLVGVTILGPNTPASLGRNDQINLFDSSGQLVERVNYGDETYPGAIRTQNKSGQVCNDLLGANEPLSWQLAAAGDAFGSFTSTGGDRGTPGTYASVPCDLPIGSNYCTALINQNGTIASISALGSTAASNQHITLHVAGADLGSPSLFLMGTALNQIPFSFGNLCVDGTISRISPVIFTSGTGTASYTLDFSAWWAPGLVPGSTHYFQQWYRELGGSNLTDGIRIDLH